MPGLDRPNAPRRLPSGVFIGPQFKRGMADPMSQTPHSAVSSPSQISPKTLVLSRKTFSSSTPGYLRQNSSSNDSNESPSAESSSPGSQSFPTKRTQQSSNPSRLRQQSDSWSPDNPALSAAAEGSLGLTFLDVVAPRLRRGSHKSTEKNSSGSSPAGSDEPNSARSSISTKARKLLSIPPLRISNNATKDGGPPRQAKRGFHWQREISGHWLEIRIGKRQPPGDMSLITSSEQSVPVQQPRSVPLTPAAINRASSKSSTSNGSSGGSGEGPLRWLSRQAGFSYSNVQTPESLAGKTMRRLGFKRTGYDKGTHAQQLRTNTGEQLEHTSSLLSIFAAKQAQNPSTRSASSVSSSQKSQRSAANSIPKWQRMMTDQITSDNSPSNESSTSESTLQKHPRPPQPTPDPREMYTGANDKQYFRVEMTDPDGPNFLPSEARRVNTPPVGHYGRNRGFFFNLKPPDLLDKSLEPFRARPPPQLRSLSSEETETEAKQAEGPRPRRVSMTEWYNVQLDAIEHDLYERTRFVNEVPDHLSNSPLCPLHPKNISREKSCPLHGEKKVEVEEKGQGKESEGYRGSEVHAIEY